MIPEVEEDAMLHLFNKNIFGNGDGPSPLPLEERYVVVRLDRTRVTKDEARTMVLCMIETAVKALTLRPDKEASPEEIKDFETELPSMIDRYERKLVQWLYSSEPLSEPSPPEHASGPLLVSQPTEPSTTMSDNAEPTNMGTVPPTADQPSLGQHAGPNPATYVSSTAAVRAPQPQPTQQPTFLHPAPPIQQPAPTPVFPYHAYAPPIQHRGLIMQQPLYHPHNPYLPHGPVIGPAIPQHGLLPPPPMIQQPVHQPIIVLQPTPMINPRSSLPPARRQASQSEWAPSRRKFNVAEWAQEHRPRTPHSSTNAGPQTASSVAPTASNPIVTPRYGPNVEVMYPRGSGQASEQLRSLTSTATPTYSDITKSTAFPFEVAATNTGPVTGGVLRISNVSMAEG